MMNNYSSQIIRAVRKYYQLKQVEFAPILSTTQSALSKIEAGHLELSASQWLAVCDHYILDPRSLFTGKIENLGERKFGLQDASKVAGIVKFHLIVIVAIEDFKHHFTFEDWCLKMLVK